MSIKKKLYLAFFIVVSLFLANGVRSYINLKNSINEHSFFISTYNPVRQLIVELKSTVVAKSLNVEEYLHGYTAEEHFVKMMRIADKSTKDLLIELDSLEYRLPRHLISDIENIKKLTKDFDRVVTNLVATENTSQRAFVNEMKKFNSIHTRLGGVMDKVIGLLKTENEQLLLKAKKTRKRAQSEGLATLALATMIALGSIFFILKRINLSIFKLKDASYGIAQGNLPEKSFTKVKDEFGDLGDAFSLMAEKVAEKENFLKTINKQLSEKTQDLLKANNAKAELLRNMNHEVRSPISIILGFCDILKKAELSEEEKNNYLDRIESNGHHLLSLIDDLLEISKIENKQVQVHLEEVDLLKELDILHQTYQLKAQQKGLVFKFEVTSKVNKFVITDAKILRQILINLVGNAIKFTDSGEVSVFVDMPQPNQLEVDVKDTGIGVLPEFQEDIFKPFFQVNGSRYGGSGLGLPISFELARELGGSLKLVRSGPNVGSHFRLNLEVLSSAKGYILFSDKNKRNLERAFKNCKFLIVEDDKDFQEVAQKSLKSCGAEAVIAESGGQALDLASKYLFDVVLMDINMPDMDGWETTKKLRLQGIDTPIIALSAYASKDDRIKSLNAGCTEHLNKPLDLVKLSQVMQKTLDGAQISQS